MIPTHTGTRLATTTRTISVNSVQENDLEIQTLPTIAYESQKLVELHGDWRDVQSRVRGPSFVEVSHDIAMQLVEQRAKLFARNAEIQAENVHLEGSVLTQLEANEDAIKLCTILLGEISAALGMTSLPAS
jgi:hypothetical protein